MASDTTEFAGLIFLLVFMVFIFSSMTAYNATIECPELSSVFDQDNPLLSAIFSVGFIFSPCSGIPLWATLLVFVPLGIAIIVKITPFIG
ncbi:MAG: hypothetical protein DRN81_02055 [Thermoproteota archaeon]|nr:MAG: hypothetical protein DRN81_02055 [Candidatus Korarchaeota archaeon]